MATAKARREGGSMNVMLEILGEIAEERGLQVVKNPDGTITLKEKEENVISTHEIQLEKRQEPSGTMPSGNYPAPTAKKSN